MFDAPRSDGDVNTLLSSSPTLSSRRHSGTGTTRNRISDSAFVHQLQNLGITTLFPYQPQYIPRNDLLDTELGLAIRDMISMSAKLATEKGTTGGL